MKLLTQWAITSSALILIFLALRFFCRDKLSARLRYALWAIVLARLLVPFQIELPAAASPALPVLASNLVPEVADVELYALRTSSRPMSENDLQSQRDFGREPGDVIAYETNIHHFGDIEVEGGTRCYVLSDTGIDTYFFYTTLPKFLLTLWVIGAIAVVWTILQSNRYFFGRLKYYRHPLEDTDAPIPVYRAANLTSPCLFGVVKPAVYVTPEAAENQDALRHVLAHELTHYAHKDHIWSLLRCLALALHWYNPLVWLAVVLSKGDGELACDEGAVARLGEEERIPYGRTLVDMVANRSAHPADLLSCSTAMTGGKKSIQQRVASLVKKPETVRTALFAAVAVVALAAVFVFAERTPSEPAQTAEERLLAQFQTQVDSAVSIRYCPPLYSSTFYPNPITDVELLALAKVQLARFVPQDPDTVVTGWAEKMMDASRIVLSDGKAEATYALVMGADGRTYLFSGADFDARWSSDEGETLEITPIARTEDNAGVAASIANYARLSTQRAQDPNSPVPMTQEELSKYSPEVIWEAYSHRLQGWDGDLKDAEFHYGLTSPEGIQLWYRGDENHEGVWVLELLKLPSLDSNHSPDPDDPPIGYSVLADQPMVVFNAARYAGNGDFPYDVLGPSAFAAFLQPEDVTAVYLSQNGAPVYGAWITINVETIKDLMVQGLYHQRIAEYDREKYNQYAITLEVEKKLTEYREYELAPNSNRLTLSIGSEADMVCLRRRSLSNTSSDMYEYVYSPELYRTIRELWETKTILTLYDRYHGQLSDAVGLWRSSPMLHNGKVITDNAQLEQMKELLALEPLTEEEASRTWDGVWYVAISFTGTPPDADWDGSGDCYYYVSVEDSGTYIIQPIDSYMSTITGAYVGRIPEGHWDTANELFENAPSVDDRKRDAWLKQNNDASFPLLEEALETCSSIWFEDDPKSVITDPKLLAQAKEILTSGYLIDNIEQTGEGGDYERISIRYNDGGGMGTYMVTNQQMRQELHRLIQEQG